MKVAWYLWSVLQRPLATTTLAHYNLTLTEKVKMPIGQYIT
jgi:hypothetical protein